MAQDQVKLNDTPSDDLLAAPFLLTTEEVYYFKGHGTIAGGRVERGIVRPGDIVEIVGFSQEIRKIRVNGLEKFGGEKKASAQTGEHVYCVLALPHAKRGKDLQRGQVLAKPGSIKPCYKFEAELHIALKEELLAARNTPFETGYWYSVYIRTRTPLAHITLPVGMKQALPGETVIITVTLKEPIAIEPGLEFIVEDSPYKWIGYATVTNIIE